MYKWISKNPNVCPLCKNYEQKNASSILNVLLSKLIISCVNKNKGCKEKLGFDSLINHEMNCMFNPKNNSVIEKSNASNIMTNDTDNSKKDKSDKQDKKKKNKDKEIDYEKKDTKDITNKYDTNNETNKDKVKLSKKASNKSNNENINIDIIKEHSMSTEQVFIKTFGDEILCKVVLLGETGNIIL